jgi:hypothetical protein
LTLRLKAQRTPIDARTDTEASLLHPTNGRLSLRGSKHRDRNANFAYFGSELEDINL